MCLEVEYYGISQPPQGDNESTGSQLTQAHLRHLAKPLHRQQRRNVLWHALKHHWLAFFQHVQSSCHI